LFQSIYYRQKSEENRQCEQNNQVKPEPAGGALEVLPSPSTASSSRTAHINKSRRTSGKPSSQRLNRPLVENDINNASLKPGASTNAAEKNTRLNTDEVWETIEDDANDELPQESLDVTVTTESADLSSDTGAISDQTHKVIRNFKRRQNKKKSRPNKKVSLHRKESDPKDGDEIVVETLVVYSSLTVVWQDGTVETGIPSTELYPIHHLDNHEFFPGDFVSKANDYSPSQSDYGVIQSVDHDERIAKVKWFNIYGNLDNPV